LLEAPLGAHRGTRRGADYTRRVLAAAHELAEGGDERHMPAAMRHTAEGTVALLEGRWRDSLEHVRAAEAARNTNAVGHSALGASTGTLRAMSLYWMGRAGELLEAVPAQLRRLEERGNLHDSLWLSILEAWALSCGGRIDAARAVSEKARARLPTQLFALHRWYLEFGQVKLLLLEGEAEAAWRRLEELDRTQRVTMLGQSQRVSGHWVRASVALGRAVESPATRASMVAEARRRVRRMEKERVPWVSAIATTVHASIAEVSGDRARALSLLADAEPRLEAHDLESVLAVSRLVRGRLVGGEDGRIATARAERFMSDQRVVPEVARVLLAGGWA
jgi:hypothetical protein